MDFCTSIHCLDGRIQEPIIQFLKSTYKIKYVDTITEPGPINILAKHDNKDVIESILTGINISIEKHDSGLIAVSGHYDCIGNPVHEKTQKEQIKKSRNFLKSIYRDIKIIGLWIDNNWSVHII